MKNPLTFCFFLAVYFSFPSFGMAVVVPSETKKIEVTKFNLSVEDMLKLDKQELEKKTGRKLKLREKIALKIIKRKLKKQANKTPDKTRANSIAITGFSISLASLLLSLIGIFLFPFFIILAFIGGIFGIIFSSIALRKIKHQSVSRNGKGLAITGLVTGVVLTGAWVTLLIALIISLGSM